jgi:hypothetical protein
MARDRGTRVKFCSAKCSHAQMLADRWEAHYTANFAAHFWSKVDRSAGQDACWPWIGRRVCGYGMLNFRRHSVRANRMVYRLVHGEFDNALFVCHRCDNPICVNPAHLWLGTHQDNMDDRNAKGRTARGERHGKVKARLNKAKEGTNANI